MEWKYTNTLRDTNYISQVEKAFGITFPKKFNETVLKNNAGYPKKEIFDTKTLKGRVFANLLDFNLDEKNNILKVHSLIKNVLPSKIFPFGIDPGGDYLCFDYRHNKIEPAIILWKHEGIVINGKEVYDFEVVSESFDDFLKILYSRDNEEIT